MTFLKDKSTEKPAESNKNDFDKACPRNDDGKIQHMDCSI